MSALWNALSRCLPPSWISSPSLEAGTTRGTAGDFFPERNFLSGTGASERKLATARVEDLYLNTSEVKSAVNSIASCSVGVGLKPQASLSQERLSLRPDQASKLQEQMEWLWWKWSAEAHHSGRLHFNDLQLLGMKSLVRAGELLHMPVRSPRIKSKFTLRIQDLHPSRLRTPFGRDTDPLLRDGVELSATGEPVAYWIACPQHPTGEWSESTTDFRRIPARIGHLPGILHLFRPDFEEQYRGISPLATGLKSVLHLDEAKDFELVAQRANASVTMFIGLEGGVAAMPGAVQPGGKERKYAPIQEIRPGQIAYGNRGEEPKLLESNRPSANFVAFCEMILRSVAASMEIPYEVLTKDFTKTTFSSARAALIEAWRVYDMYRDYFVRHYCQTIWQMVMEEAVLTGQLQLPVSLNAFYEDMPLWCNAMWVGPAQGYIDPVKEVTADQLAVDAGFTTRKAIIVKRGGDPEEVFSGLAEEKRKMRELDILPSDSQSPPAFGMQSSGKDTEAAEADETADAKATEDA